MKQGVAALLEAEQKSRPAIPLFLPPNPLQPCSPDLDHPSLEKAQQIFPTTSHLLGLGEREQKLHTFPRLGVGGLSGESIRKHFSASWFLRGVKWQGNIQAFILFLRATSSELEMGYFYPQNSIFVLGENVWLSVHSQVLLGELWTTKYKQYLRVAVCSANTE